MAAGWALKRWGRGFTQGVWWGIFWRVAVIGFVVGIITGAVQAGAAMDAAVKPWSPEVLFVTLIPHAVILGSLVVTLRAYGWARSTMIARRLAGPAAPALRPIPAPTASPQASAVTTTPMAAPAPAPAARERLQCPKCGLRETERGQVIGWRRKVCGWRESR